MIAPAVPAFAAALVHAAQTALLAQPGLLEFLVGLAAGVLTGLLAAYARRLLAVSGSFGRLRQGQVRAMVPESAAAQARLAAALSHTMNSPLGALSTAFDTLVQVHAQAPGDPDQRDRFEELFESAARSGRQSITRLRETLARIKHLTVLDGAEERIVDINELWTDTVARHGAELQQKADLQLDLKPLPPVRCRPQQLRAIFSNILRNAAAAMEPRGAIWIRSSRRNGKIVLEVQDTGRGIQANKLSHIFDPTFRVRDGRISTANWGFFITRCIIGEHGGRIEIDSEEGRGTTVRILLPVAAGNRARSENGAGS
jgi:signal transduction histidine kinase